LTFNGPHGVISQNIVLFITTAVRTSNLTQVDADVSSTERRTKSKHSVGNRSFENVAQFRYLGTTITIKI
jgi:hypothetical protein